MNCILEQLSSLGAQDEVGLSISYNQLRWVPDELFSIKKLTYLDLQNNLLLYIPNIIECLKDHLTVLNLGNYEKLFRLGPPKSCRTSGNKFEKIPPAILKLSNLQRLDIKSVGLENFPDDEIYKALPSLVAVNVSHNNLPVIPASAFEDRNIVVISRDNPGSSYLSTLSDKIEIFQHHFYTKPRSFMAHHPFIALSSIATMAVAMPISIFVILLRQ